MKKITYQVTNPQGIHARPAALLVKKICGINSKAVIEKSGKAVDAKSILGLMSLGIKQYDIITVAFDGEDEEDGAAQVEKFLEENL